MAVSSLLGALLAVTALLFLSIKCNSESCCQKGNVRLSGRGSTASEGLVEVCGSKGLNELVWKTVCTTGWDENEAKVVCRQLGLQGTQALPKRFNITDTSGERFNRNLQCKGNETNLLLCRQNSNVPSCINDNTRAGVYCIGHVCDDFDVRLVGGENEREGRVEICYNGVWGSVCDDGWNDSDATVLCRQLDFGFRQIYGIPFGVCDNPVLLSYVNCTEQHSMLSQCVRPLTIGLQNCTSGRLVGVNCTDRATTSTKKSPTSGIVGGTLAVLILMGIVLTTVVVIVILFFKRKRAGQKEITNNGYTGNDMAVDNPTYGENESNIRPVRLTNTATNEREFQNPLYSKVGGVHSPAEANKHIYDGLHSGGKDPDSGGNGGGEDVIPVLEETDDQADTLFNGDRYCYSAIGPPDYSRLEHCNPAPTQTPVLQNSDDYSCLQHK